MFAASQVLKIAPMFPGFSGASKTKTNGFSGKTKSEKAESDKARSAKKKNKEDIDVRVEIDRDIFQYRSKPACRFIYFRLRVFGEFYHLRVAAALEVEHSVAAPAVLVVADQGAAGVSRKRRTQRCAAIRPDAQPSTPAKRARPRQPRASATPAPHRRPARLAGARLGRLSAARASGRVCRSER